MDEGEILKGLRTKKSNEAPKPNLFCPKNGLDNGVHLRVYYEGGFLSEWLDELALPGLNLGI